MFPFAVPRLADPRCHRGKRDDERQEPEADIGTAPTDVLDQPLRQLGHDKAAEPHTRHRDAERQPATPIEPGGDRLCITERGLDRARHLGQCEHQGEDPQHGRSEPQQTHGQRVDNKTGQRHGANAPAIHHAAEDGHGDGTENPAKRQGEGGGGALPAGIRHDRLEEHAEREAKDGAVADEQAGDRADDNPPRIGEFQPHDPSPRALLDGPPPDPRV